MQLLQCATNVIGAPFGKDRLCHFQFDQFRWHPMLLQTRNRALCEIIAKKLNRGGVDRDMPEWQSLAHPSANIREYAILHEVADLGCELIILEGLEIGRAHV